MGTSKGYSILVFCWTISIIIGYSSPTLLKPCEGENLQDCVKGAESILLDANMTFPDDNETLQSVCSLWDEMRDCAYNYTARCLTPKENQEFHQYFHKPMSSMRKICTDPDSTQEYFQHAHCIKTISTVDRFCGAEYQLLITEILSINVNTMKRICCALSDFKDCVIQKDADHVCGDGPDHDHETDGDISSYALKTLEKSLLAFVTHSCTKEGFDRSACLADADERLGASSNEVESILIGKERPPGGGMKINQSTTSSTQNHLQMTTNSFGITQKTLLVPVFTSSTTGPEFHSRIAVNVSSTGEKGKISSSITDKTKANENSVYKSAVKGPPGSLNGKLTENLEAKIRNASLFWSKKDPNPTMEAAATEGDDAPHAEKRVEVVAPLTKGAAAGGNLNSSLIKPNTGNSRSGYGRALNLVSSLENGNDATEKNGEDKIQNDAKTNGNSTPNSSPLDPAMLSKNPSTTSETSTVDEVGNTAGASSSNSPQSGSKVPTIIPSPSTPSAATAAQEKVKDQGSMSTAPASASPSSSTKTVSTTTTTKPTAATTTMKVTMGGGMKNKILENGANSGKKKILSSMYNATRAGDSKNKSNVSLSDVPIRVFLIWLSTFFV